MTDTATFYVNMLLVYYYRIKDDFAKKKIATWDALSVVLSINKTLILHHLIFFCTAMEIPFVTIKLG